MQLSRLTSASTDVYIVWAPAVVSALLTILATLVNLAMKNRLAINKLCLFTLGLAPLCLYLVLYAPFFPSLFSSPGPLLPYFLIAFVLFVPNYLICFLIAILILFYNRLTRQNLRGRFGVCASLLLIHVIGLIHTYYLWHGLS